MLKQNELVEQFNKEEQKRRRILKKKLARRIRSPKLKPALRKILDRLDEKVERSAPVDCLAKKWIK
ncbi:MAG: hypothetical protein WC133_06145 [Candidatus Omnitrophota bacterium]